MINPFEKFKKIGDRLKEMTREKEIHAAQCKVKVALFELAIQTDDSKSIESARQDLITLYEAQLDMQIRNHKIADEMSKDLES